MRQSLHLLIVDDDRRSALAGWHGGRWLLPLVETAERVRCPMAVLGWLKARGLWGEVVGQWLGRAQAHRLAMDWTVVVLARERLRAGGAALQWTSLTTLLASPALLAYQRFALSTIAATGEAPITAGPFGDTNWPEEMKRWAREVLAEPCVGPSLPHRLSAYEVVAELSTKGGRFFVKGLPPERVVEATVTMRAHDLAPDSFPRTVASAPRADGSLWWLMEACPGRALAENMTAARAADVAAAWIRVQRRIGEDGKLWSLVPAVEVPALERWLVDLLAAEGNQTDVDPCAVAIREVAGRVDPSRVPWAFVPCDLDPSNVIVDGNDVRFIDLDDAVVGPALLAVATFTRRVRRPSPEVADFLLNTCTHEWQPPIDFGEVWSSVSLLSRLVECHFGWKRMRLKTERGEIQGVLDLGRRSIVKRLVNACTAYGIGID